MAATVKEVLRRMLGYRGTGTFVRGVEQPGRPNPKLFVELLVAEDASSELGADVSNRDLTEAIFLLASGSGVGDVDGPSSSTDNAIARFDGTTGKLIQNSSAILDDSGNIATPGTVDGRDVSTDGATLDTHVAALASHGFAGIFIQATAPTTVQIPTSHYGFWRDTVNLRTIHVVNVAGVLYGTELTAPL